MQDYIVQIYLVSFTYYKETLLYYYQAGMQLKLFFINYLWNYLEIFFKT